MTIFRCSAVVLLAVAGCRGEDPEGDARRLGLAFCRAVRGGEERSAEALMTPALQARIEALRAANPRYKRRPAGEVPPPADALPLAGVAGPVATCTPAVETPARVGLAYAAGGAGWRDRLELERGPGGRLLVADIVHGRGDARRFSDWVAAAG